MEDDELDISDYEMVDVNINNLQFGCAICGQVIDQETMLGMTLFPSKDPEAFQQWFVHALCAKGMLLPTYTATCRDELAEIWEQE